MDALGNSGDRDGPVWRDLLASGDSEQPYRRAYRRERLAGVLDVPQCGARHDQLEFVRSNHFA
jgi:hypothetical protein